MDQLRRAVIETAGPSGATLQVLQEAQQATMIVATIVLAANPVRISRQVVGSGGHPLLAPGIKLQGTVGQVAVGQNRSSGSGTVLLHSGFWQPNGAVSAVANELLPDHAILYNNVPNPFNPITEISFAVGPQARTVRLRIYDVQGRLVRTLLDNVMAPGVHKVIWQGDSDLGGHAASGIYFSRLEVGNEVFTNKMTLLK